MLCHYNAELSSVFLCCNEIDQPSWFFKSNPDFLVLSLKISSLMAELDTLKKEKSETEEARKTAEEQIKSMRKVHEEKVIILSLLVYSSFLFIFYVSL